MIFRLLSYLWINVKNNQENLELTVILLTLHYKVLFMESVNEQIAHIKEMRRLMESSSRFLSLSGFSGILCGIYALIAATLAYYLINRVSVSAIRFNQWELNVYTENNIDYSILDLYLFAIAVLTLLISLATAFLLSSKKAKKSQESIWNPASKNLLLHLFLPLGIGGIFGIICMLQGYFILVPSITIIFYGIALISASKYTYGEVLYLGILESVIGLISLLYIGYGLLFWAVAFGLLHIIYGTILHFKYDRN